MTRKGGHISVYLVNRWAAAVDRFYGDPDSALAMLESSPSYLEENGAKHRVVDPNEAVMHPDIYEAVTGCSAGLGYLVLMMRELQIHSTTMDVKMTAQAVDRHGRAFDMPARSAIAPRRLPARLTRLGRLPEHKIQWIILGLIHGDTFTRT